MRTEKLQISGGPALRGTDGRQAKMASEQRTDLYVCAAGCDGSALYSGGVLIGTR